MKILSINNFAARDFLVNFLVILLLGFIYKVVFDTKKFGSKGQQIKGYGTYYV